MKKILFVLGCLLGAAVVANALTIEHVEPRKMEKGDYTRIPHYFGKDVKNPTRLELHAQENPENGMAWIVEIDEDTDELIEDAIASKIKLEVLLKGEREKTRKLEFDLPETKVDCQTIYLGVGSTTFGADHEDAPFPKILAWRVSFENEAGEEVAVSESALWKF